VKITRNESVFYFILALLLLYLWPDALNTTEEPAKVHSDKNGVDHNDVEPESTEEENYRGVTTTAKSEWNRSRIC
jgi:hypothetical protein